MGKKFNFLSSVAHGLSKKEEGLIAYIIYRNDLLQLLMYASQIYWKKNLYFFVMQKRLEGVLETSYLTLRINNWEKIQFFIFCCAWLTEKMRKALLHTYRNDLLQLPTYASQIYWQKNWKEFLKLVILLFKNK